jgi:energy-coupling factor transport system ATP-binding protein
MEEAARADRVVVINDGKLVLDSSAKEVFSKVDFLHSIGLEAPQGVELVKKLKDCGFKIEDNILSENECFEAVLSLFRNGGALNE